MPNTKGHPRRFATGDELIQAFKDYLAHAEQNGRFPSIAGFCVFADITTETYYSQREYYNDAFKKGELMLEEAVLSLNEKLTTRAIFYLKNKFKYRDVTEQNINQKAEVKVTNLDNLDDKDLATMEAILAKTTKDDTNT